MADEYIDKVEVGAKIQMMYIRREMDYGGENDFCRGMRKALRVINNMPVADVQSIKHGRWECVGHDDKTHWYRCSVCGHEEHDNMTKHDNYCSSCGADMRSDTE